MALILGLSLADTFLAGVGVVVLESVAPESAPGGGTGCWCGLGRVILAGSGFPAGGGVGGGGMAPGGGGGADFSAAGAPEVSAGLRETTDVGAAGSAGTTGEVVFGRP